MTVEHNGTKEPADSTESINLSHFDYAYNFASAPIQEINPFKAKSRKPRKRPRLFVEYKQVGTLKFDSAEAVMEFGRRMAEARKLSKLTQEQAAALLGYRNSTKLNKIELGTDTHAVPWRIIIKAAKLYDVTSDFLLGLAGDEWERDPVVCEQKQIGAWLLEHFERTRLKEMQVLKALQTRQVVIFTGISRFLERAKENMECVNRVQELNPEFEELRGGAKLLRILAETAEEAMGLSYELQKLRALTDVAKPDNVNLDIFEDFDVR
jgi:transcriptional regulator with XRE-family HTH domain